MMLLNGLRLISCVPVLTVAVIGSTVAQEGAVLLHQQNYSETVGLGSGDAALFRQFYVAAANSPQWDHSGSNAVVAPFQTPPLRDGFSGSFILDATAPDRSEFASRIMDTYSQADENKPHLYLGLAASADEPAAAASGFPELTIGMLDAPAAGSTLAFVRFDINEWQVSEGVVSYDIDISYWGKPAAAPAPEKTIMAMGSVR